MKSSRDVQPRSWSIEYLRCVMLKMHRAILVSSEAEAAALFREGAWCSPLFLSLPLSLCLEENSARMNQACLAYHKQQCAHNDPCFTRSS